jgi:hypothetical protein
VALGTCGGCSPPRNSFGEAGFQESASPFFVGNSEFNKPPAFTDTHSMYLPNLYLETTMFNFFFYGKGKETQVYTKRLFDDIAAGQYKAYTSDYVINELKKDTTERFNAMNSLVGKYNIDVLPSIPTEIARISALYIKRGIIPEKYKDDALHIAAATVNGLDFVISYNYNHIVKLKTIIGTGLINRREGYQQVSISTPLRRYWTMTTKKKSKEEMTERELLAHLRAVKRAYSKELNAYTSDEEMAACVHANALKAAAEWGIELKYADLPSVRTIQ